MIPELLSAELPDDYEKEAWQLNDNEKLSNIERLRNLGNIAYKNKDYETAESQYCKAVGLVEQLIIKYKVKCVIYK